MRHGLLISCAALLLLPAGASAGSGFEVRMRDRCEPFSFNQALGAPVCQGDGNVTFGEFIEELQDKREHGAWRLKPERAGIRAGHAIPIENEGGELHTFTAVENFGGGFVPELNELSGNPEPAPECTQPPGPSNLFVEAGETATLGALARGTHRFECCVHPWMRSTLHVR